MGENNKIVKLNVGAAWPWIG